jgi:cell wall assembly regulator SMI1
MTAFSEIINILQAHAQSPILDSPATSAEISEVEGIVDQQLPEDIRAAYRLGNGEAELVERTGFERDPRIFSGKIFHSTQKVIYAYQAWKELLDSGDLGDNKNEYVISCLPPGTVKNNIFNQNWVPIAGQDGINIAIDFDPGPKGVKGQIILHDIDGSVYFQLGTSFNHFCEFLLERYKNHEMHRWVLTDEKNEDDEELFPALCRIHGLLIRDNILHIPSHLRIKPSSE